MADTSGIDQAMQKLLLHTETVKDQIRQTMDYTMTEAENKAKRVAPWTDRTGNARSSIYGVQFDEPTAIVGQLGIGVEYGKYLELKNQGKYRVIRPVMDVARELFKKRLASLNR